MTPVYDIWTILKHEIYNTSKDNIVEIAKKQFFEHVESCFNGGVQKCTNKEFIFNKIDEYGIEHYNSIWESCDTRVSYTNPNGPAIVEVYQIIFSKDEETSKPLDKILIFSLPKKDILK